MASSSQTSQSQERILLRGVNWLGDAVMSTPALQRLREARPTAHITLLTHEKLKDIWAGHPAVDEVQTFSAEDNAWSIARRLKTQKFDVGLILPNSHRSALEMWLGGVRQRIGISRPWRSWMLSKAVRPRAGAVEMHKRSVKEINWWIGHPTVSEYPAEAHHIYQYLHLVTALGGKPEPLAPHLAVSADAVAQFAMKFRLATRPPVQWFGLNAGAEYGPAKRWPEERFIAAAIEIQKRTNCRWLVFGVKQEKQQALRIATAIYRAAEARDGRQEVMLNSRVVNLAGVTSVSELCAGLKLCRVMLTNDSGPMHVAAAVGTPVVVPFGSTSPELTGPGLPGDARHQLLRANAPCAPCFLRECPIDFRCMNGITVEQVVEAAVRAAKE